MFYFENIKKLINKGLDEFYIPIFLEKLQYKLKLIITKSQFKALTFIKNSKFSVIDYFKKLKQYDYHIGISGVEPAHKEEVKLCYQFFSTLPMTNEDWEPIIKDNITKFKE